MIRLLRQLIFFVNLGAHLFTAPQTQAHFPSPVEVTRQVWNARGEVVQSIDGATNIVSRVFDAVGNQVVLTNRNGKKWQFQYDAANRLTNTITPLNRQTTLTYDNRGLLKTIKEPSTETTTNNYDAKGRLTNRVDALASTRFLYDANNNVTQVTNVGQASSLSWVYDAYDRVTSYTNADGSVIGYRYDQNHNLTNLIYPDGKVVKYFYDRLNRLTNVTDWATRQTVFTYDLASRLTSITRPNGTQRIINYDAAGQTTNIIEKTGANLPIAFFKLNWNNAARMEWEFAAPLPHSYTPPTRVMTYDDDNRLATFNSTAITNDSDGNTTYAPLTNSDFVTYTYDTRNRLTNVGGTNSVSPHSYAYDPLGNRTSITNGTNVTKWVINPNAALSQALVRVKNGVTNYYVYGLGLLYEVDANENTKTYHSDYRGSTIALTADSGSVIDRMEYSAYGTTTYRASTNDTPFLYNGRYGVMTDSNGLLYMRARYYNPFLCRFINADPSGFAGGLNHYAFADGNPVSLIDPFGLGTKEPEGGLPSWLNYNTIATAIVPGQGAWNNAMAYYQNGHPVLAAMSALQMVGEQVMFVLTLGQSGVGASAIRTTEATAPVFWSGHGSRTAAETWAANNGGQTLSMSRFAIAENATLPQAQSASAAFARSASGNVQVFQPAAGIPVNSIWGQIEYPALMQNPNVSSITYRIFDASGNVVRTITP